MRFRDTVCALACLGAWAMTLSAQAPEPRTWPTRFDVASVKRNESDGSSYSSYWSPGRLTVTNMPLRRIISRAYDITLQMERYALAGGAARILDRRFDILATTPGDVPQNQIRPMIRTLLAERFKLRVRWEERPTSVYMLRLARPGQLGAELARSAHNCAALQADLAEKKVRLTDANRPRDAKGRPLCWPELSDERGKPGLRVSRNAGSIADLIADAQPQLDRPLIDGTALQGNFEWQITLSRRSDIVEAPRSMGVALSQQLGLKLEGQSAPFRVLVIDSVEMPTPD